jgi:hypothetical protein
VLQLITQWSVGFSFFSLLLLWIVYWFVLSGLDKSWLSRSSQSNFDTAFREITGETPGQFRKNMEKAEVAG